MVSPELIRRYPFFGGLRMDHVVILAKIAEELKVEEGFYFFGEDEELTHFYLIVEGEVTIVHHLPHREQEVIVSTLVPGEVFGWSGLIAPHKATAGAKALSSCRVLAFDCHQLRPKFEDDCYFGYQMMEKMAQVIRGRLQSLRTETLAYFAE